MLLGVGWICLLGGLFGLVATRLGWYESGGLKAMDWFDLYGAAGRTGFYFINGIFAASGLGIFSVFI
jgi:hypothetical protein